MIEEAAARARIERDFMVGMLTLRPCEEKSKSLKVQNVKSEKSLGRNCEKKRREISCSKLTYTSL